MVFISEFDKYKICTTKITNKAKWFDTQLSTVLNTPLFKYKRSDEVINLGSLKFEKKYCNTYEYINKTNLFVNQKFVPEIKDSDKKKINKVVKKLKELDENSNDKKIKTEIKELNTKKVNLDNISANITKCERVQIFPTQKQSSILQKWIKGAILCYNKCVDLYTENNGFFKKGHKSTKLEVFKKLYNGKKDVPYDVLTDEVRKFCSNLKSCKSNLKNKNIKHFEMKHINTRKKSFTIFIPKSAIKTGKIYGAHLGKMKGLKNINSVTRDCTLTYDKIKNKYFLGVPKVCPRIEVNNRESICALDEGEVVQVAYHGENSFGHLASNMRPIYIKKLGEISRLQKIIKKGKNKNGEKLKNKSKLKKSIQKKYEKLQNISKEVRNKVSLFLVKKFDKIIFPKFETQRMIRNKKFTKEYFNKLEEEKGKEVMKNELRNVTKNRRLNRKIKFSLNMQAHYKFRQHLINKADEYGCILVLDSDENETTKACTICGSLDNKKYKRTRECICCGTKMDRDISAGRNTLMKGITNADIKK